MGHLKSRFGNAGSATCHESMRVGLLAALVVSMAMPTIAGHPKPYPPVTPRVDVIGPIGNRLPPSYRRKYKRPTYLGGKLADAIAPSSQEAMTWRKGIALGWYEKSGVKGLLNHQHQPPQRYEQHFFYPKPWEVLKTGPRVDVSVDSQDAAASSGMELLQPGAVEEELPSVLEPAPEPRSGDDLDFPEDEVLRAPVTVETFQSTPSMIGE